MAINKAQSPMWVKVTLVVLIVAFVLSFITIVANPFSAPQAQQVQTTPTGAIDAADAQYQPQVNALTAQLQQKPQDYQTLVTLANTYFDWALAKQQAQASQTTTATAGADLPLWIAAKDTYARAIAVKGDESPVRVDHAIAVFYSGDVATAIQLGEAVVKDDPTFSSAPFNLGIFYRTAGDNAKALAAFEKYLELDPTGSEGGNLEFAKQQIAELKAGGGASQSATTTP